jgi:transposase
MLAELLLPSPSLRLDFIEASDDAMIVTVTSTTAQTKCPSCGQVAERRHSQYLRTLADLPFAERHAQVRLHVRRFFCDNPLCQRKTFAERLPDFAPKSARRTRRLAEMQAVVALALGGEAGARLVGRLQMPVSPDTLLRLVRRRETPGTATPRWLGIDDWAWKKGHRYGTILVDLERRCPVELLPDRATTTVAAWLKAHPGVEIISRDRAGVYAEGATQGAPDAIQVADRWHLLSNLREAIQRLLDRHHKSLPALRTREVDAPAPALAPFTVPLAAHMPQTRAECVRQEHRARRLDRYAQVVALRQRGVSIRAIAQQMNLDRRTVRRYINADAFPEIAKRKPKPSILDPWKPYLRERWGQGCHNGSQLLREIRAQGYHGSRGLVSDWLADLRKTVMAAVQPANTVAESEPPKHSAPPAQRRLSPKQAAWLVVKQPDRLSDDEEDALAKMCQANKEIEQAHSLAQSFGQLVRERRHQEFDRWIESAKASDIRELKNFAVGLLRDKDAVLAALRLPWSNGQVEGQVNRLKLIKRTMYGRANFEALPHFS